MSDIFGRKPCLVFAYAVFGLGSLFCGLARNLTELVTARAGRRWDDDVSLLFFPLVHAAWILY